MDLPTYTRYSDIYFDDNYDYRHVAITREQLEELPKLLLGQLLKFSEWKDIGVNVDATWEHYAIHKPEPHILLFRRPRFEQRR